MKLLTERYDQQRVTWPASGKHILAQFDDESVVVYQAYRADIGQFAATHGYFGGSFSFDRMSWVKPNFLWMMYRSGWGTKADQEVTLAIRVRRHAFDQIVAQTVHSSFAVDVYGSRDAWERAVAMSDVRLQWDPDHDPTGRPILRRAVQLGLRGAVLRRYAREWVIDIEDISGFVHDQRERLLTAGVESIVTPRERVYRVSDPDARARLQLDQPTESPQERDGLTGQ